MSIPSHPALTALTSWLDSPSPSRALIIEDGSKGSISPLARWLEDVRAAGSREVISASIGPGAGLVLERDILFKLHVELYPDEPEGPVACSLADLRAYVRGGLRAGESQGTRLIALDRVGWGEQSFRLDLGYLLGRVRPDQKIVASVRAEDGGELDVTAWLERLGWRAKETLCLRLPAWLDGELAPKERARVWVDTCLALEEADGSRMADVLDGLAAARRPLDPDELAMIVDLPWSVADVSLRRAPEGAVTEGDDGRYAFLDPTVAEAWAKLRASPSAHVRERLLALGEAARRGEAGRVVPYVIEHHGALLFERGRLTDQIPLVGEGWANAWSPLGDPLGFEADVARVWLAAERELIARASAPEEERTTSILTMFRCVQVSKSVMSRAPGSLDEAAPSSGDIVKERASALARLAEELSEPERAWVREQVVDALLPVELTATEADLLVQLAAWFEGERRDAIVAKALATYREEIASSTSSVWLLRAAPLLTAAERRALCDEVIAELHELPDHDAAILREALDVAPPDVARPLTRAIPALPEPDRVRLECAIAPHLKGDARRRIIEEILDAAEANPPSIGIGDVRTLAPALDVAQLSGLVRALRTSAYSDESVGICLRALCALGSAREAESLMGPDLGAMPFDCVLALAAGSREPRAELREELMRRLSAMDETRLGFTIERDAAELVGVLGVDVLIHLARTITGGEERIVARVALVPFAAEAEKRALVGEAVEAFRAPTGQEGLHWRDLLSCWEWMAIPDACHLLVHGSHDIDVLWALKELAPLLRHLTGNDTPLRIAEQLVEVGRWAP